MADHLPCAAIHRHAAQGPAVDIGRNTCLGTGIADPPFGIVERDRAIPGLRLGRPQTSNSLRVGHLLRVFPLLAVKGLHAQLPPGQNLRTGAASSKAFRVEHRQEGDEDSEAGGTTSKGNLRG